MATQLIDSSPPLVLPRLPSQEVRLSKLLKSESSSHQLDFSVESYSKPIE